MLDRELVPSPLIVSGFGNNGDVNNLKSTNVSHLIVGLFPIIWPLLGKFHGFRPKGEFFIRLQVYEWIGNFSKRSTVKCSGKLSFFGLKKKQKGQIIDRFCGCKRVTNTWLRDLFMICKNSAFTAVRGGVICQ